MSRVILRPHHALCLHYFIGKGYGGGFVENMFHIKRLLCEKPDTEVVFHHGTDEICAACPNRSKGLCSTQEKVERYDRECAEACGFAEEKAFLWRDCAKLVEEKIIKAPGGRERICFDCLWKTLCQQLDVEKSVESVKNSVNITRGKGNRR